MSLLRRLRDAAPTIVGAIAAACATHSVARGEAKPSAVVIMSRDDEPYQSVLAGIRASLSARSPHAAVEVYSLQSDLNGARSTLVEARRGTAPIITVGSVATQAAVAAQGDAPLVACMIVSAQGLEGDRNATGVVLEFPVETQLRWMRRFVPEGKSIGVVFNTNENREEVAAATSVAARLGLRIVAREVDRPQALPDALNSLAREADVLWGMPDRVVVSPQTAEAILLFSFRNRIPFAGLSATWVKAGALYALDRDYNDLGAQCGDLAGEVLGGRRPSSLPPVPPRRVTYALNLRTAEHLKIELAPELIEGAEQVFR